MVGRHVVLGPPRSYISVWSNPLSQERDGAIALKASGFGRAPMPVRGAQEKIVIEVVKLRGVEAAPHRFGGTEFRLGRRELGHVHGDCQADVAFPMDLRNRLVAEGRAEPHHILPQSGWVTFRLRKGEDVGAAVELFRLSYEAAVAVRSPDQDGQEPWSRLRPSSVS